MRRLKMIRICDFHGRTVATSQNLRGITNFAASHPVDVVTIERCYKNASICYEVKFYFLNARSEPYSGHYSAEAEWADSAVFFEWLVARRSWSITRVTIIGNALWDQWHESRPAAKLRKKGTLVTTRDETAMAAEVRD